MKKVLIIMIFIFMAQTIISCCNCYEPYQSFYSNKLISVQNIDDRGPDLQIATGNEIPKNAYGIRLQLLVEETTANNFPHHLFSFNTASAFSCHCRPPFLYLPKDSITSIQVYTNEDFDDLHDSNTDISAYFQVYKYMNYSTIEDYLNDLSSELYSVDGEQIFDLLLMTVPTKNTTHSFTVKMILSDGRTLEAVTEPIDLM